MCHLPRYSPILPAFRDPNALLDRLQARQEELVAAGREGDASRLWGRITRVARWQAEAEYSAALACGVPEAEPKEDALDALIAEIGLSGAFSGMGMMARAA